MIMACHGLIPGIATAQFHSMPTGESLWVCSFWIGPGYPWESWVFGYDSLDADTVINGAAYTMLSGTPVRDDLAGRVYAIEPGNSNERMLYDYTAMPGDTLHNLHSYMWSEVDMVVITVDTIEIVGTPRRRMGVGFDGAFISNYWIQGIGSLVGPLEPCACPSVSGMSSLVCMSENGIAQFGGATGQPSDCMDYVGQQEIAVQHQSVVVHPNPGIDRLNITMEGWSTGPWQARVYDMRGTFMGEWGFSGPTSIDVKEWASGMYVIELSSSGRLQQKVKWSKQVE